MGIEAAINFEYIASGSLTAGEIPMENGKRTLADVLRDVSGTMLLGDTEVTVQSRGYDGDTALHVVARRNDIEGAKLLIAGGADVNAIGEMGETPLHVAARAGNHELKQILLRAGARRNIVSEFGEVPE